MSRDKIDVTISFCVAVTCRHQFLCRCHMSREKIDVVISFCVADDKGEVKEMSKNLKCRQNSGKNKLNEFSDCNYRNLG